MRVLKTPRYTFLLFALCLLAVAGCKRTRDSFTSRTYHRMVSKFNPLFNGEQAYIKGTDKLEKSHVNNFDEILDVYLVPTEKESSSIKPDMDKAVEKGAKVIQEHSMLIRNDQKNSFIDNSYMLIGKARFYKGEYLEAIETFNFVVQEYEEEETADEARVWAAKALIETENYLTAKANVEKVYRKSKVDRDVQVEALAVFAQIEIQKKNYEGAVQLLTQAVDKTRNRQEEIRWLFIMGQLYSRMGNLYESSEKFNEVIKKGPPYELLFQAQLNRARNYDLQLQSPNKAFGELRDMLKDDKNIDNKDQIYYVMAELSERLGEDARVEEFLGLSIRTSTVNDWQKGLSYLKFGEINFDNRMYPTAAAYYDSSFSVLPKDHKRYPEVKIKKESLGELVKNINTIEEQDSLQRIAQLTEKQRLRFINKLIDDLEEADREAAEAEANAAFNTPLASNNTGNSGNSGGAGSFYFYNQSLRGKGLQDFRNRLGNRKLEDHWRRENKESEAGFNFNQQNEEEESNVASTGEDGESKYKVEDFLNRLPLTDSAMQASHAMIVDAFMNIGRIYKDDLKDYRAASVELEKLLKRYPALDIEGRVWYTLYRIYTLDSDETNRQKYRNKILSELPDSEYATLILNEGKPVEEIDKSEAKKLYVRAYDAYTEKKYDNSYALASEGVAKFAESTFGPRFFLLRAYSIGRTADKDKLPLALKAVVDRFPDSPEAKAANDVLAQIDEPIKENKKKPTQQEGTNYAMEPQAAHRYILIVPNVGVDMNNLRNSISDFSTKFFKLEKLSSRAIFLDKDNQVIIVTTLANKSKALNFYNTIINQKTLAKYLPEANTKHFVISNNNFQKFYKSKNVEEYLAFFKENYLKAQ